MVYDIILRIIFIGSMNIASLKNNKLLRTGASFSIASTLYSLCTMIVGFLNMRWLGPELLGIWQSVTIINSYLPIVQLGIQSGLNLELPVLLGGKKDDEAKDYVATAFSFAFVLAAFFTVISIVGIIVLIILDVDINVILGVVAVSIMAIASCFRLHYIATYRSAGAFNKLTKIYFVECFIIILMIGAIYLWNYYGLLIYNIIEYVTFTVMMWYYAPYRKVSPKFNRSYFKVLLKRGVFMTIVNQIKGIIESLPRLILLNVGGVYFVGLFNPALVVGSFMNLVPNQIAQFLHPQLGYKYGQTKQAKDMWRYFMALTIYVPLCLIPVALIGWFLIPYALEYMFPKYIDSLWPIRIMLVGFLFATTYFTRGFLITIKAYYEVVSLYVMDLVCFVAFPLLCIKFCPYNILVSMSTGLSMSYFITYIVNIIVVRFTIFKQKYN